jgi:hypothetical protein
MHLGKEFNIHLNKELIRKNFPRIPEEDMDKMLEEVETKEGLGEGSSLRDRLPGLFNRGTNNLNAVPGGKNGGNGNGRSS